MVLLQVMVTARLQLSHLFILTPVIGMNCRMHLLLRKICFASPVLWAADNVLCSLPLTSTASSGQAASYGIVVGVTWLHGLFFCLAMVATRQPAASLLSVSAQATGFSHSVYWPFRQEGSLCLFAPLGCKGFKWQIDTSPLLRPTVSFGLHLR